MANDGNGGKDADPLLQNLMSPSINPPPTLFPLPEHSDVDVVNPMPVSPSELKNRLIFGPFPSSSATTPISDFSTVKPKPSRVRFSRSNSSPAVAAINDVPHRSYSTSKSTVRQAVALTIVYLAVMTVATVLYGDQALKTFPGWLLAAIWLIVSTFSVSLAFYYLAVAIRDKRSIVLANRVLAENMSITHFLAADIDNNGYLSLSEYVLYKLKEMQKITDKDIKSISDQFYKIDRANKGKITLSDLLETSSNDLSTAPSGLGTHIV